jgi:hypothetical protein
MPDRQNREHYHPPTGSSRGEARACAGEERVLRATIVDAALGVVGLSARWVRDGLGEVRATLAACPTPTVLVGRGVRPGGLAPATSLTRFTWSLGPS